jgi:hypothetical protein
MQSISDMHSIQSNSGVEKTKASEGNMNKKLSQRRGTDVLQGGVFLKKPRVRNKNDAILNALPFDDGQDFEDEKKP